MVTTNVIYRVFHIRYGIGTGTCFVIDSGKGEVIVTAKHVVSGIEDGGTIELYHNQQWLQTTIKLHGHHPHADVSVFSIETTLGKYELPATSEGMLVGQDTLFLGFPYTMKDENSSPINRDFPIPLVKKATLSGYMKDENGAPYMFLDGINNPGFSGGPVIFKHGNDPLLKVAGVISGFNYSNEPAFQGDQATPLTVRMNTGIIIAYTIENALELIE